jgi:UDP-N-acetylmuramate dehydrogenase
VDLVRYFDGEQVLQATRDECAFTYRESIFKRNKNWTILSATLRLPRGDRSHLRSRAAEIQAVRDAKYPPEMRCAGSIFKNLLLADLNGTARSLVPERVVIEGKVPAGWFLEQVGAKGMREGDIQVADYHGNLIYNDGSGSSADFHRIVEELKRRVREKFLLDLEEEVQYIPERAARPREHAGTAAKSPA